jgi:2-dehydropantoate 2-reductase
MFPPHPIIAVVGAGAVGTYYGGRLAQHGADVHFLLRSDYEAVSQCGWTVRSCDGDFVLPPDRTNVYREAREMPRTDLVIVTLKATANDQYDPLIRPLLKDHTAILTLQNGLGNEERLAELFGPERVLGGLAFVCINRIEPGVVHHMDHGLIRMGEYEERVTDRLRQIVAMFQRSKIHCELVKSLRYARWEKLVWNIPFNGLGAACDLTTDQLIGTKEGEQLVRDVMGEVVAAARAVGANLPADVIDEKIKATTTMGPYRSSMQVDRQQRRAMEVEAILGEPVRAARRAGVAVPKLEMLYRLVWLVDRANAKGLDNAEKRHS